MLGPRNGGESELHWLRHERFWLLAAGNGAILALAPARAARALRGHPADRDRHAVSRATSTSATRTGSPKTTSANSARCGSPTRPRRRRRAPMTDAQEALLRRLGTTTAARGRARARRRT